jgi:hypothetical protein
VPVECLHTCEKFSVVPARNQYLGPVAHGGL